MYLVCVCVFICIYIIHVMHLQDPPMEYFEVIKSLVSQQRDTCHALQVPYDVPLTAYSGDGMHMCDISTPLLLQSSTSSPLMSRRDEL